MIIYVYGELFYSPARVLVNPVNTVGAMSSGLARDFKRFFPEMYALYRELCHADELAVGQLFLHPTPHKWILNFPIKRHWRAATQLQYIEDGLKKFALIYADYGLTSVSFPAFDAEDNHLDWNDVHPLMLSYLGPLPISIFIHLSDEAAPFAAQKRNLRVMRHWLHEQPQLVTFAAFWDALLTNIRHESQWRSLQSGAAFHVAAAEKKGRQRRSIKLTPQGHDTIFIPETQLQDLWQYVRRAGYVLPQNLPAGLEAVSEFVITLLASLPFCRPVQLATGSGTPVIGLHHIPPVAQPDALRVVPIEAE